MDYKRSEHGSVPSWSWPSLDAPQPKHQAAKLWSMVSLPTGAHKLLTGVTGLATFVIQTHPRSAANFGPDTI